MTVVKQLENPGEIQKPFEINLSVKNRKIKHKILNLQMKIISV